MAEEISEAFDHVHTLWVKEAGGLPPAPLCKTKVTTYADAVAHIDMGRARVPAPASPSLSAAPHHGGPDQGYR